jgi:predicted membrane protein
MALQSSSAMGRAVDRIIKRFPGATEFLFGMLVGFVSAAVLYALTKWFWLAAVAEVVAAAVCGLLWLKVARRPNQPKRS